MFYITNTSVPQREINREGKHIEQRKEVPVNDWVQQRVHKEQHVSDAVDVMLNCDVINQERIRTRWQVQSIVCDKNYGHHASQLKNKYITRL